MTKIYCQKCGVPHSLAEKPNFCTKCGNPFNSRMAAASVPAQPARPVRKPANIMTETDDEDGYETEINTDLAFSAAKLDVELERDEVRGIKIESVMGTADPRQSNQESINSYNENYSIDDFKREAGSIRS